MKMKRYTAPDMRQALKLVRDEQGADAVILASRRVEGRVEITVAIDDDEPPVVATAVAGAPEDVVPAGFEALLAARERGAIPAAAGGSGGVAATPAASTASTDAMNGELKTLRRMLETQLAALAWNDLTRRAPLATELLRELTEIGFAADVSAQIADQLPPGLDFTGARRLAIARLADRVAVTGDRWCEHGGVVALVGAPGVGKTTAIARLAARWVLRHGPQDLALVCADGQRFGAPEQTSRLGRLLGAATFRIGELAELPALLERLAGHRLVLIDTAGAGPRGAGVEDLLRGLQPARARLEVALVLAASAQAGTLAETTTRFQALRPDACVLTRLDESASLGGALSVLMRAALPIAYVSEGPGIPDDLRPARALDLVCTAVQLAERNGAVADEDLLARRFGGSFNVAS
ncbi:MAG: flagellar biosynthesis protein FlhF [Gammaproteobacteria bacterium]|nr:flagellar biosynthesis protein FlhF [Gammaproteobacteria bacterium]